jgi:hypothetical protein
MSAPKQPSSRREKQLVRLRERRAARVQRREKMLEFVVSGFDRVAIARQFQVSPKTVQREVDRALDGYSLDGADRYLRLQIERLNKALRIVDDDIEEGDSAAVTYLIALMGQLDRYHGYARAAASLPPASPPPPAAPRLELAAAPLALPRERTPETS